MRTPSVSVSISTGWEYSYSPPSPTPSSSTIVESSINLNFDLVMPLTTSEEALINFRALLTTWIGLPNTTVSYSTPVNSSWVGFTFTFIVSQSIATSVIATSTSVSRRQLQSSTLTSLALSLKALIDSKANDGSL